MIIRKTSRKKRSKVWTTPTEELSRIVKQSHNIAQVLKHFGYKPTGGTHTLLKHRLETDGIDFSHMKMGYYSNVGRHFNYKMTKQEALDTLFLQNSDRCSNIIRKYVKYYSFLEYKCVICKNDGNWNGTTLSLQLDHKNGINNDHRLENLRWLCPNCHSQTATFGSKNRIRT